MINIYEKTLTEEITTKIFKDSHVIEPPQGHPICTRSQMVKYQSPEGEILAVVHQYLLPNGKIGASGKPDPKKLYLENEIIYVPAKKVKG